MVGFSAAVIGTGFIGPVHIEGLRRAGVHVQGVLGSSLEKSQAAATRWGLPRAYADLNELLADPGVGAVHVASPNRLHFEMAAAALRAGKHVLCEKPLAMTAAESAELVRLAAASGCAAGVAYNVRFYPLCHEAAAQVRQGKLGRVLHVAGSYVQDWLLRPTDFNWRVLTEDAGELRAVADIGTHWLDLVQFIVGQPIVEVCADLRTIHPVRERPLGNVETFAGPATATGPTHADRATRAIPIATEDYGAILLRFADGAPGCLWVSQVTAGRKNQLRFEIAAADGSLAFDSENPERLWVGQRDVANRELLRDPALLGETARPLASYPGGHAEGFSDTFKQLFRAFYGAIAAGTFAAAAAPFPTFADGQREIVLCEAILRSHRQRRWVAVD